MTAADLPVGALVVDGDDDPESRNLAVAVNTPPIPAAEWEVDDDTTVAEYPGNDPYPDSAPVVLVVFRDALAEWRPEFDGETPIPAADLVRGPCYGYAFPAPRLEVVGHLNDEANGEEDSTDEHDTDDTTPELVAIADALRERRVEDVRVADGADAVMCEKIGVTYHVAADGSVQESGRIAEKLEEIARDALGDGEEVKA